MNWSQIESYVFDVDGTLYSQRKVRMIMGLKLLLFYLFRPLQYKELLSVYYFRKLREMQENKKKTLDELFVMIGAHYNCDAKYVSQAVKKWMFEEPLNILKKYKYTDVVSFVNTQKEKGKTIIIYSDYPAESKLESLQIKYNMLFVSGERGLVELKPSLEDMRRIIISSKINPIKALYVGDRNDKDRVSAGYGGINYLDIREFRRLIR